MSDLSEKYQLQYGVQFIDSLGDGKDGSVLKTAHGQAVKFFDSKETHRRELRAYQILRQRNIDAIIGFQVPRLVRFDDEMKAIEMSVVRAPFLLDFASAYTVDEYNRFEFTEDVLNEREAHWAEVFGDRWSTVRAICNVFTSEIGLILLDLSPNNVRFE